MKVVPLAEDATLGTLLTAPESPARDGVLRWLRPEDFTGPWHGEVYRTIRSLASAGDGADPEAVGLALMRRVGPTRAQVVRVAGLLHSAPLNAHPDTYARMVLEASLRRETAGHGLLLRVGALQATLEGSARPLVALAAVVDDALDAAADRWATATGTTATGTTATGTTANGKSEPGRAYTPLSLCSVMTERAGALAADKLLAAHPSPTRREVAEREATLIAALITHPTQIGATSGWLRPPAVTNRTWRPVYEAVLRLHTYGHRIDPVTVLWETQRGAPAAGPGPDPKVAMRVIEANITTQPGYVGRQVAGDHLRLAADRAADALWTAVGNPGLDLSDVLGTGHIITEALRTGARPLEVAGTPPRLATVHALPTAHAHRAGPVAG